MGVPKGIRTPVAAVKGQCPRPLDDGDKSLLIRYYFDVWWSQAGSNRRPLACHASALPAELWPRVSIQSHLPDHKKYFFLFPSSVFASLI